MELLMGFLIFISLAILFPVVLVFIIEWIVGG
jgi:hypothetical protein